MPFVQRWEGEWDAVETPEARLSTAWTDPATVREALAVMCARGGYCRAETTRRESDERELLWLRVAIPLTGPLIAVDAHGREERYEASLPHPDGPSVMTLAFSWTISGHFYAASPDKQADLAAYAARHPERIEERT